jgi:HlyD family secretion protein
VLVPDQQVNLAFLVSGNVKTVNTSVGQNVEQGEVLATLDDTLLQLQLDQANLVYTELTSPMAVSNAQKAVADDASALDNAKGTYNWWLAVASHGDLITKAEADLAIAQDTLKKAQEDYDKVTGELYTDKDKAVSYQKLYTAQLGVKNAKANLDLYQSADPYQLAIYKADVDVAEAKLADDQTLLAALTGAQAPQDPTGSGYAQLVQARSNINLAQTNLDGAKLVSPINGVVSALHTAPGEFASAGQVQVSLINMTSLHVETTDLSERDVPNVKVGQDVEINIKPLNQTVPGKVTAISPQADTLGGDVVYKVIIKLDKLPDGALPGMSVTANFLN